MTLWWHVLPRRRLTPVFLPSTRTQQALQRPVKGQYPHLVAVGKVEQRVDIVGIVETEESLHDLDVAARRWRALEHLQAAIYLYVPRGYCPDARALCLREQSTSRTSGTTGSKMESCT